jgi:hypothetical protein
MKKIMKRNALSSLLLILTAAAQAADYEYLTIEKNDGTTQSLTAIGLKLTYGSSTITATNGSEQATFALSDLKRMYFSNTKGTTAIDTVEATANDWDDTETEIYDLRGHRLPQGIKPARGLYIFKKGNTTTKKYVK